MTKGKRHPHVFILILENGGLYDSYAEETAGVFSTLTEAWDAYASNIKSPCGFNIFQRIEEWRGSEECKIHYNIEQSTRTGTMKINPFDLPTCHKCDKRGSCEC